VTLNRREMLLAGAAFGLVGALSTAFVLPSQALADDATTASPADLAYAGPDGDIWIGSDKAPVTIIEYASMTCPHCAHFSETTFPELKKRYIDTGKVRYTLRTFPLDQLAAAGFMIALCDGKDKYMSLVETLFAKQDQWIVKDPVPPLEEIAKQFGFTDAQFKACLANQKMLDDNQADRRHLDRSDGQGDRTLSQDRIRVFSTIAVPAGGVRRACGPATRPECLDNSAPHVALADPTIHSPRRCGGPRTEVPKPQG